MKKRSMKEWMVEEIGRKLKRNATRGLPTHHLPTFNLDLSNNKQPQSKDKHKLPSTWPTNSQTALLHQSNRSPFQYPSRTHPQQKSHSNSPSNPTTLYSSSPHQPPTRPPPCAPLAASSMLYPTVSIHHNLSPRRSIQWETRWILRRGWRSCWQRRWAFLVMWAIV